MHFYRVSNSPYPAQRLGNEAASEELALGVLTLHSVGARWTRDVLFAVTFIVRCDDPNTREIHSQTSAAATAVLLLSRPSLQASACAKPIGI